METAQITLPFPRALLFISLPPALALGGFLLGEEFTELTGEFPPAPYRNVPKHFPRVDVSALMDAGRDDNIRLGVKEHLPRHLWGDPIVHQFPHAGELRKVSNAQIEVCSSLCALPRNTLDSRTSEIQELPDT